MQTSPADPWDATSDFRSEYGDHRSERSTSAPPPETDLFLGQNEAGLGKYYLGSGNSLFLNSENPKGRASVPASLDHQTLRYASDFPSRSEGHYGSQLGALDRQMIGETMIRSQSAAPSLDGRLSLGPPPGLENSETPIASNASSDSYLESDRSHLFQLGQRRPASTGVIGESQNSSSSVLESLGLGSPNGAVRPAAKTLMDLIQEDFPPESPVTPESYQNDYPPRNQHYSIDRPRTTSPMSHQPRDQRLYTRHEEPTERLAESFGRFQISHPDRYGAMDPNIQSPQYPNIVDQQRISHNEGPPQGDSRVQNSMYAPLASQPPQKRMQNPNAVVYTQQPPQYEQRPQQPQYEQRPAAAGAAYGSQQTQVHSHVQTQVLPSGQAVYIAAPPHHPAYGYASVQYHPQAQQPHLVHQTIPGAIPPHGDQYISVVPIQGGGAPVQTITPGGAYAFWQPEGQSGQQTLTIVNAHAPGAPVAVARVGQNHGEPLRQQQRQQAGSPRGGGGRGKVEKGGKSRRGGSGSARSKNQSSPVYSSLLDDFKSKKKRDWTIQQIKGHVVEFCQDQNGSRFIQQRLEVGDTGEKEVVIREVLPSVRILRNDVFGNYVVQKLLDFGTTAMRADLQKTLQGEMLQLSMQMYGCRVVQKALETLDESELPKLLIEFHNNVLSCIHDQNGNHVIQKCIEAISEKAKRARSAGDHARAEFLNEQIDFIVDDVFRNVTSLSCHPYGCRVLQRILEHCTEPKKNRALDEIRKCHKTLLDDQYGNYVIQHVLQFGRRSDQDSILQIVVENGLLLLSRQKFASNVVEKLLKYGTDDQRKGVVREMLKIVDENTGATVPEGTGGSSVVLLMVRDAYANYVVQTTLDLISESEEKVLLLAELNSHASELKNYTFAKHIVTKLGA